MSADINADGARAVAAGLVAVGGRALDRRFDVREPAEAKAVVGGFTVTGVIES